VFAQQNLWEAAIASYQRAIHLNPRHTLAHNAIGAVLASQEQWEEAIAAYRRALSINPNHPEAWKNLGQALWQQGDYEGAIAALEEAHNLFEQRGWSHEARQVFELLQQL